ncbi:MAG: hypothetical protein HC893_04795 [Chloroflexaceae bacterium]|nr:hypothetical protein [Chloroflexaceae bacterium]
MHIRPVRLDRLAQELQYIQHIYNAAWANNWNHTPMNDDEIAHLARSLRPFIDPDLVLLAEDGDRPVACRSRCPICIRRSSR